MARSWHSGPSTARGSCRIEQTTSTGAAARAAPAIRSDRGGGRRIDQGVEAAQRDEPPAELLLSHPAEVLGRREPVAPRATPEGQHPAVGTGQRERAARVTIGHDRAIAHRGRGSLNDWRLRHGLAPPGRSTRHPYHTKAKNPGRTTRVVNTRVRVRNKAAAFLQARVSPRPAAVGCRGVSVSCRARRWRTPAPRCRPGRRTSCPRG